VEDLAVSFQIRVNRRYSTHGGISPLFPDSQNRYDNGLTAKALPYNGAASLRDPLDHRLKSISLYLKTGELDGLSEYRHAAIKLLDGHKLAGLMCHTDITRAEDHGVSSEFDHLSGFRAEGNCSGCFP
jgi:hypothetical protein